MKKLIIIMLISILAKEGFSQTTSCTKGNCDNGWGIYEWISGANLGDKYVGEFKNGIREGVGVYTWHTGDKYVGNWANGAINGYGTQYFADGSKMSGSFKDATLVGTKVPTAACLSGDCDNGYGVWVYDSGDLYAGYWSGGFRNGEGVYLYADGQRYVGNVVQNKRNGYGTYNWLDGSSYAGNWRDGQQDGYGTSIAANGSVLTGTFEMGKYIDNTSQNSNSNTSSKSSSCLTGNCDNGWGVYEWETGDKYAGDWKSGTRDGDGVYTWANGDKYVGGWIGGIINGYGTQYYANGTKSCGYWESAKLIGKNYTEPTCISGDCNNGYGVRIFDTGDKFSGYFKDTYRTGSGTYLYTDGEKYAGNFDNNKRNGYGIYYWTDGSFYEGNWKDGSQEGQGTLTKVDGTKQIGKFDKGNYVGESSSTNLVSTCLTGDCDNGFGIYTWGEGNWAGDKYIGDWRDGQLSGKGYYYWHSGSKYIGSWENGKQNGFGTQYYSDGTKAIGEFKDGSLLGSSKTEGCVSGNCANGFGIWIFESGDMYEGYFNEKLRNGAGIYLHADGMKYNGNFANDQRNGYGTFYWTDGSFHAGNWKDGNQDGPGSYTKADGTLQLGKWENGVYVGASEKSENDGQTYLASNSNTNFTNKKASVSDRIKSYVEEKVNLWQQKGEFEKTVDYKLRVTETIRNKKIEDFQKEAIENLKKEFKESVNFKEVKLGLYDADNESFLLSSDELGEFVVGVPVADAPTFKQNFNTYQFNNPDFFVKDNSFVLSYAEIVNPVNKKKYIYDSKNNATYATTNINYKFNEIVIDVEGKAGGYSNNIKKGTNTISIGKAEVDVDIPVSGIVKTNTYALIIGNEDYTTFQPDLSSEVNVDFAANDARVFKEYCVKTFGIPEKQVKLLINATSGQMNQGIAWLTNLISVDEGNAEIVFYYSGHGLPDEKTKEGYLIPVDVSGNNVTQGINLNGLYAKLNEFPSKKVTVFLDACFSGGARNQALVAMKGVKVRPKENVVNGKMVVFTSSSGDEASGVYREKQHGYMTYYLLKNIQDTKGNISYKDLANALISNVKKETALDGKVQTPQVNASSAVEGTWETWKIK